MEKGNGCCSIMASSATITFFLVGITLVMCRVLYAMYRSSKPLRKRAPQPVSTLIVLGSGGHTAEMLNLLSVLQKDRFSPRIYIAAATDNMSLQKARLFENSLADENGVGAVKTAQFMQIYRSREVGQSYVTSVWTTLLAIVHALQLMIKIRPQVILCNGPGTCIPLCAIAFLFKAWTCFIKTLFLFSDGLSNLINSCRLIRWDDNEVQLTLVQVLGIRWSSIFYVESIARVKRLSLSGLLLYKLRIADELFVQWPQLQRKYPRAHYVGCLM